MTPPGPRSSALSRTQPQSIQGIYWDLSKQRISKLYRFFISNNPSPRIRTFKSQSNLTSDRWPGSISLLSASQLSWSLSVSLMSSLPIRHPDTRQLSGPVPGCQDDTGQHCEHDVTLSRGDQWPRYQDTLATSQHLESSSVQIILD